MLVGVCVLTASAKDGYDSDVRPGRTASAAILSQTAAAIVSNWPAATIETGSLNRAALPSGERVDYKWANELSAAANNKQSEMKVPEAFAIPPPSPPRGMLLIPGGLFVMGNGVLAPGSRVPTRKVASFYIDGYEVPGCVWTDIRRWAITQGYTDLAEGQDGARQEGGAVGPDHPVVNISWHDCVKWCNARSEKERLVPVYYVNAMQKDVYRTGALNLSEVCVDATANGYRLPTEAEWEMAARGGVAGQLYPWGDKLNHTTANYWHSGTTNRNGTTPIGFFNGRTVEIDGQKQVVSDENGYGLHDVAGNVYEWCWDWFGPYTTTNAYGPATGTFRVMRGGCWASVVDANLSCGYRNAMRPAQRSPHIGFRCVRKH
jgi:formylglycine-generating enzyme required for sulfatase activity